MLPTNSVLNLDKNEDKYHILNKNSKDKDKFNETITLIQKSVDSYNENPPVSHFHADLNFISRMPGQDKQKGNFDI